MHTASTVKYTQQLIFTINSKNKCIVQNTHCKKYKFRIKHRNKKRFFEYFFAGLKCVGHFFAYVAHFVFFERCLDSYPESCRSKEARYRLSNPSPCLATHLPT